MENRPIIDRQNTEIDRCVISSASSGLRIAKESLRQILKSLTQEPMRRVLIHRFSVTIPPESITGAERDGEGIANLSMVSRNLSILASGGRFGTNRIHKRPSGDATKEAEFQLSSSAQSLLHDWRRMDQ
jgi:hypothetical protein